jgi:hypothetical protein
MARVRRSTTARRTLVGLLLGSACLLLLLLLPALSVHAADPILPALPLAYSAVVSANYAHLNFTLAYEEYSDALTNPMTPRLRTNGRFMPSDFAELLYFGLPDANGGEGAVLATSQVFSTDPGAPDGCTASRVAGNSSLYRQLQPSREFFVTYVANNANLQYKGHTTDASERSRFIVCDEWTGSGTRVRNDDDGTGDITSAWAFTYFAAVPEQIGLEIAPVRLHVTGTETNSSDATWSRPFEIVYDWVDFSFQPPPASVFALPEGCAPIAPEVIASLPERSFSVDPSFNFPTSSLPPAAEPLPTDPFPSLPADFRVALEAKLDVMGTIPAGAAGASDPTHQVQTFIWSLNTALSSERIDFEVLTDASNSPGAGGLEPIGVGQASRIQVDSPTAVGGATVYRYTHTDDEEFCTTEALSLANPSPLDAQRAGSLRNLFSGAPTDSDYRANKKFKRRTTLRGVPVDVWSSSHVKLNGDALFVFEQEVYLFNNDWRFPGRRSLEAGVALPMRVVNTGTFVNASISSPQPYVDVYDFFAMLPSVSSAAAFDPVVQWGATGDKACPPSPTMPSSAVFPSVGPSTSYSTRISASVLNKGYTIVSDEYVDGPGGRVWLLGRNGPGVHIIDDRGRNTSTLWFNDETTGALQCYQSPYVTSRENAPLSSFFAQFGSLFDAAHYVGRLADPHSRFILADRWQTRTGSVTNNGGVTTTSNMSATFYASVTQAGIAAVPLRIHLTGFHAQLDSSSGALVPSTARLYTHVYDFLDFELDQPAPSWLEKPATLYCEIVDRFPSNIFNTSLPSSDYVVPEPLQTPPFPQVTALRTSSPPFHALLEAKIRAGRPVTDSDSLTEVFTLDWRLDRARGLERIQRLAPAPHDQVTVIVEYETYPTQGHVYTLRRDGQCDMETFGAAHEKLPDNVTLAERNPAALWALFDGALLQSLLLDGDVTNAATPGFLTYQTSSDFLVEQDRGIACDTYTSSRGDPHATPDAMSYKSRFYTSAPGWTYVGRDDIGGAARPVRVHVSGFDSVSATAPDLDTRAFEAVMDLYRFDAVHDIVAPGGGAKSGQATYLDARAACSNYDALNDNIPGHSSRNTGLSSGEGS